jgi:hypothetical protein
MRRILGLSSAGIVLGTLLVACAQHDVAEVVPNTNKEEFKDIPVSLNRDLDILFVIDNSGSMEEEQAALTANFYSFIEVLEDIEGGLPNVHIGVVSTDVGADPDIGGCEGVGDNGTLQTFPRVDACQPPAGAFIRDLQREDGTRDRNYDETQGLADTFACIAELGIEGCGFEMPLESMKRALNGANPSNQSFLRDDAYLAVIFIADEDDCSTEDRTMFGDPSETLGPLSSFRCFEFGVKCDPDDDPRAPGPRKNCTPRDDSAYMYDVQSYVDFLKNLKEDDDLIIVAGILGNETPVTVGFNDTITDQPELEPSCTSASGEAAPSVRLRYFLEQFPQRNTFTTICNPNLSDALLQIADLLASVIGNPCLDGALTSPPECIVSDVRYPGTNEQTETIVPVCGTVPPADSELPCWHLEPDEQCDTASGLSLVIERGDIPVPLDTHVQARCVVE